MVVTQHLIEKQNEEDEEKKERIDDNRDRGREIKKMTKIVAILIKNKTSSVTHQQVRLYSHLSHKQNVSYK